MMIHIPSMKEKTKGKKIGQLPDPSLFYMPLQEKFGSAPLPVVQVGEKVQRYQIIGRSEKGSPALIHSPVSGVVKEISEYPQIDGSMSNTIVIENDFLNAETREEARDPAEYHTGELLDIIRNAGIVGAGGAEFPTSVKFDLKGKIINTFIINGAECEPYMTADYAVMAQKTRELLDGILIVNRILQASRTVLAFESQNRELKGIFEPFLQQEKYRMIEIQLLPDAYPQGGELQLIKTVTGMEISKKILPAEAGVIVSNVGTIFAVYEAVFYRKPFVERVMTVTGEASGESGNYLIKIGTPLSHILQSTGMPPSGSLCIVGGPMMGKYAMSLSAPVTKGSGGILLLKPGNFRRLPCIWCGYCVDVCPMHLMPMKYEELFRKQRYKELPEFSLNDCIECGACEYICPSKVPLVESIKKGKSKLKEIENANREKTI